MRAFVYVCVILCAHYIGGYLHLWASQLSMIMAPVREQAIPIPYKSAQITSLRIGLMEFATEVTGSGGLISKSERRENLIFRSYYLCPRV